MNELETSKTIFLDDYTHWISFKGHHYHHYTHRWSIEIQQKKTDSFCTLYSMQFIDFFFLGESRVKIYFLG